MIPRKDWEFNVIGIYNYHKEGKLEEYFNFIERNHDYLEGDILEAGVYNGKTLLATALFLRGLGSSKLVYGFDSFSGFESVHENDHEDRFLELHDRNQISTVHYNEAAANFRLKSYIEGKEVDTLTISTSGNFSSVDLKKLYRKIELLELDNIRLVQGFFKATMVDPNNPPRKIMAAFLDCDLYMSYKLALPFVWERLVVGGYVFLDEYYSLKFPGARIAVDEFFVGKKDKPKKYKTKFRDFERWYVRKIYDD